MPFCADADGWYGGWRPARQCHNHVVAANTPHPRGISFTSISPIDAPAGLKHLGSAAAVPEIPPYYGDVQAAIHYPDQTPHDLTNRQPTPIRPADTCRMQQMQPHQGYIPATHDGAKAGGGDRGEGEGHGDALIAPSRRLCGRRSAAWLNPPQRHVLRACCSPVTYSCTRPLLLGIRAAGS